MSINRFKWFGAFIKLLFNAFAIQILSLRVSMHPTWHRYGPYGRTIPIQCERIQTIACTMRPQPVACHNFHQPTSEQWIQFFLPHFMSSTNDNIIWIYVFITLVCLAFECHFMAYGAHEQHICKNNPSHVEWCGERNSARKEHKMQQKKNNNLMHGNVISRCEWKWW